MKLALDVVGVYRFRVTHVRRGRRSAPLWMHYVVLELGKRRSRLHITSATWKKLVKRGARELTKGQRLPRAQEPLVAVR